MPKPDLAKLNRDIKALKESIAHWERMREDRKCGDRPSAAHCALCCLYPDDECEGCPIHEDTDGGCCLTPYDEAVTAFRRDSEFVWRAAAAKEIKYLKALQRKLMAGRRAAKREVG